MQEGAEQAGILGGDAELLAKLTEFQGQVGRSAKEVTSSQASGTAKTRSHLPNPRFSINMAARPSCSRFSSRRSKTIYSQLGAPRFNLSGNVGGALKEDLTPGMAGMLAV